MTATNAQARYLSTAAVVVLAGVVLSGPVAVTLVEVFAPQPRWVGVATYVQHYSWLQGLPYEFGFFIAGGFILFMGALVGSGDERQRPLELTALTLTAVAASLIFLNYVMQTAFVPQWLHENESLVAMATMANPASLGWALELYGYGILGIATAFAAPLFAPHGRQGTIRILLAANCFVSVIGAVLVPIFPGWVMTPTGMVLGAAWNVLVAVLMVLVLLEFRFGETASYR